MNSTAIALEAISDAGEFEILAASILRRAEPAYERLIHVGLNAAGKAVASPVDGIAGSNDGFVLVQHTTISRTKLRDKWIGVEGDIRKAAAVVKGSDNSAQPARTRLVLTTNHVPDPQLIHDAYVLAHELGIELDIWDQSRFVDFLDHTGGGHWLRERYLGIPQQLMSEELLRDICQQAVTAYSERLLYSTEGLITRDIDVQLARHIKHAGPSTFLVMPSGLGKSAAAWKLLSFWLEQGRYGLWVEPDFLENCVNIEQAVQRVVQSFAPGIGPNAAQAALELVHPDYPILLVIDDINRHPRPVEILSRIASWKSSGAARGGVKLICPLWPQLIDQIPEGHRKFVESHSVLGGVYTEREAIEAVQRGALRDNKNLTDIRALEIADTLGRDPLLIALAGSLGEAYDQSKAVSMFIDRQLASLADGGPDAFTRSDYRRALFSVARKMVSERSLAPFWPDIAAWLSDDPASLTCMRNLVRQRTVCRLETEAGRERLVFRHDRVRKDVFSQALAESAKNGELHDSVVSDPFFADVIGAVVAASPDERVAESVAAANPLAALHAILSLHQPSGGDIDRLVNVIHRWLKTNTRSVTATELAQWALQSVLARIDAPFVREFEHDFSARGFMLDVALFRNGDVRSGARLCLRWEPGVNSPFRDALIQHVLRHHEKEILEGLDQLLQDEGISSNLRKGALFLAGQLGSPSMMVVLVESWRSYGRDPELFCAFLWAALQCTAHDPNMLLEPIRQRWEMLPKRERNDFTGLHVASPLDAQLNWAFHRRLPLPALKFLIDASMSDELRWVITLLVENVDQPEAVSFVVREQAKLATQLEGTSSFSPWLSDAGRDDRHAEPLSHDSRAHLKSLWDDDASSKQLRRYAFRMWARDASAQELSEMQAIGRDNVLHDLALIARLKSHDESAIPEFREELAKASDTVYWWQFARGFAFPEIGELVEQEFAARAKKASGGDDASFGFNLLAELLMFTVPTAVAGAILERFWPTFGHTTAFVQCALFVAAPSTIGLAARSLKVSDKPQELLKYLDMHWHIGGTEQIGRLNAARLQALEPYLDLLGESTLGSLWTACNLDGFIAWRRKHVDQRLTGVHAKYSGVTEALLFAELDEIVKRNAKWSVDFWTDRFIERGETIDSAAKVIGRWLGQRRTLQALEVAAEFVAEKGRRMDLPILDIPELSDESARALRENARFGVSVRSLI